MDETILTMVPADTAEIVELNPPEYRRSYSSSNEHFPPGVYMTQSCLDSNSFWIPHVVFSKKIPPFVTIDVGCMETVHGVVLQDIVLSEVWPRYGSSAPDFAVIALRIEVSLGGADWKQVCNPLLIFISLILRIPVHVIYVIYDVVSLLCMTSMIIPIGGKFRCSIHTLGGAE